jgi:hypothetical protein
MEDEMGGEFSMNEGGEECVYVTVEKARRK